MIVLILTFLEWKVLLNRRIEGYRSILQSITTTTTSLRVSRANQIILGTATNVHLMATIKRTGNILGFSWSRPFGPCGSNVL